MNMRNLQRIAALVGMWAVLWFLYSDSTVDYAWALGCVAAIAMVLEFLGYQAGVHAGIEMYRGLSDEQRTKINKLMDSTND
jgi:steroid 5-alpha reductase family enzyme